MERSGMSRETIATIIRLALISIVVGVVLSALGLSPLNIIDYLRLMVQRLSNLGLGIFETLLGYLLLGAVIVVPIWAVMRLMGRGRDRGQG